MLRMTVEECGGAHPDMLGSVSREVLYPQTEGPKLQCLQFVDQSVGACAIKCRTEINKQHPDVCLGALGVAEGSVKGDGDGVICGAVGPVGELILVKARWDGDFDKLRPQSLQTFNDFMIFKISVHISQ